jgi:hypothetical protein
MRVRYTHDFGGEDKRGNLYVELNVDLRMMCTDAAAADKDNLIAVWGPYMKTMLTALQKMPLLNVGKYYRGRPEPFEVVRQLYTEGREVWWAAFTSVSTNFEQAAHLASWADGCVLELDTVHAHDISALSFFPNEAEAILPPGRKFLCLGSRVEERKPIDCSTSSIVKVISLQEVKLTTLPLVS